MCLVNFLNSLRNNFAKKIGKKENEMGKKKKHKKNKIKNTGFNLFYNEYDEEEYIPNKINISAVVAESSKDAIIKPSINNLINMNDDKQRNSLEEGITIDPMDNISIGELLDMAVFSFDIDNDTSNLTLVLPVNLIDILSFNYQNKDIFGRLLRESTFGDTIKTFLDAIRTTVMDTPKTNTEPAVFYVPKVLVHKDSRGRSIKPMYVNILILGFPEINYLKEELPDNELLQSSLTKIIIKHSFDAAYLVNSDYVIFYPFTDKIFTKMNKAFIKNYVKYILSSEKIRNKFSGISLHTISNKQSVRYGEEIANKEIYSRTVDDKISEDMKEAEEHISQKVKVIAGISQKSEED